MSPKGNSVVISWVLKRQSSFQMPGGSSCTIAISMLRELHKDVTLVFNLTWSKTKANRALHVGFSSQTFSLIHRAVCFCCD